MTKRIKISEYCKQIREKTGLSANAFANERNVSHTYISNVELGKMDKPSIAILTKLIRVYNLTNNDLANLDVEASFVDDSIVFSQMLHPIKNSPNAVFKNQIIMLINSELKNKGYVFEPLSDNTFEINRPSALSCDKKLNIKYLYHAKGINKNGDTTFLYIFNSSQRKIYDKDYLIYIAQMMSDVEASIRYGRINDKNITDNVEIVFATSSLRGYRLADGLISKSLPVKNIKRTIHFYNNRGRKKKL